MLSGGVQLPVRVFVRDATKSVWPYITLLLCGVSIGLASCDGPTTRDADRAAHSGMGGPMRTDERAVPLVLAGERYEIPANYFDAPLQPKGFVGEVPIVDGVLLLGSEPDFNGRRAGDPVLPGGFKGRIYAHLTHAPVGTVQGLRNLRAVYAEYTTTIEREVQDDETHLIVEPKSPGNFIVGSRGDIYQKAGSDDFTVCNIVEPPHVAAECKLFTTQSNSSLRITMDRSMLPHRDTIRATVVSHLTAWRKPAPKDPA